MGQAMTSDVAIMRQSDRIGSKAQCNVLKHVRLPRLGHTSSQSNGFPLRELRLSHVLAFSSSPLLPPSHPHLIFRVIFPPL